jgi:hypothetical protein
MVYFGNVSTALGSAGLSWTYNWEFALAPVSSLCRKRMKMLQGPAFIHAIQSVSESWMHTGSL